MNTQEVTLVRRIGRRRERQTAIIPADAILIEAAIELRKIGGLESPAARRLGNCFCLYCPPRDYYKTNVNPFTGERGNTCIAGTLAPTCSFMLDSGSIFAEAMYEREPLEIHYYCQIELETPGDSLGAPIGDDASEGSPSIVIQTIYERDPRLRELCLQHHGCSCAICNFDFEREYGQAGKGIIHVHHLEPLSYVARAHKINPSEDLIPVCPNCHAVIHHKNPPHTPNDVRRMIADRR